MKPLHFEAVALPGGAALSRGEVLSLLQHDDTFRAALNAHLAAQPARAFRWELRAWRAGDLGQPFECVVISEPRLDIASPQPQVFAPHFQGLPDTREPVSP